MGTPSNRHNRPVGLLPLTTILFLLSFDADTPAKLAANLPTSLRPPENRVTSSAPNCLAETVANLFSALSWLVLFVRIISSS